MAKYCVLSQPSQILGPSCELSASLFVIMSDAKLSERNFQDLFSSWFTRPRFGFTRGMSSNPRGINWKKIDQPELVLQRFPSRRSQVYGTKGVVASSQPLATEAGLEILRRGGNAGIV